MKTQDEKRDAIRVIGQYLQVNRFTPEEVDEVFAKVKELLTLNPRRRTL